MSLRLPWAVVSKLVRKGSLESDADGDSQSWHHRSVPIPAGGLGIQALTPPALPPPHRSCFVLSSQGEVLAACLLSQGATRPPYHRGGWVGRWRGLGEGNGVPVNREIDRAGRREGRGRSWCWSPSPGWSHLMATVVDGGWPRQERQPSHAPILMRTLISCLCFWDIKILGTNSWLAQPACIWDGVNAAGVWARRCWRAGEGLLSQGQAGGCGMSSACSHHWSSMKPRVFKHCLVLRGGFLFPLFHVPSGKRASTGLGSYHLHLASDLHPGRTFCLMATTER